MHVWLAARPTVLVSLGCGFREWFLSHQRLKCLGEYQGYAYCAPQRSLPRLDLHLVPQPGHPHHNPDRRFHRQIVDQDRQIKLYHATYDSVNIKRLRKQRIRTILNASPILGSTSCHRSFSMTIKRQSVNVNGRIEATEPDIKKRTYSVFCLRSVPCVN
jgi:hypothetical protein